MPVVAVSPVVKLNGALLSAAWLDQLLELRVERQFQVPSRVTIRFLDEGYALTSAGTATLGATLTVTDPADASLLLITAEVTSIAVEQRAGEPPELVIVGHDQTHRLGRSTTVKTFAAMTYSDVVSKLASNCGLTPSVDSTSTSVPYLMQTDSDLGLLSELARRVGYDWWADLSTLYFKAPAAGTSVSLSLIDDLMGFSVKASGHHPDQVTVDGWDRAQQALVTNTATSPSSTVVGSSTLASLSANPGSAFGQATLTTAGLSAQSQAETTQLSQAILDRGRAASVQAQGVTEGTGALKPGVTASITDAGPLSGSYPVTRVEHIFRRSTGGFITKFYAGDRRPTTLVDSLAAGGVTSNPAHRHPGLVVGVVTNINDPDNAGKVKITYPGFASSYETGWARVVAVGGGASRGGTFIPEVNDEVLVGFEGGDPRQPVVIGGLFGAKSTFPAATTVTDGKVQGRALTSRLGHVVNLLDGTETAKQAIELQLAGAEHTLHLGKDKVTLTVPAGLEITISAGSSSSLSFSTSGDATIKAPNITLQAEQAIKLSAAQVQVQASATLALQSDGQTTVKGAIIQIQSQGPLQAKGEPVMIN